MFYRAGTNFVNCFYYFDLYCRTKSVIVISSGNKIVFLQECIMKEEKREGKERDAPTH